MIIMTRKNKIQAHDDRHNEREKITCKRDSREYKSQ